MSAPITIRMGGYGPPTTGFSQSLKFIGDKLKTQFVLCIKIIAQCFPSLYVILY